MLINVLIGGEAGQGMDTLASLLEKTLHREGYAVFTSKDYMSRIRGGHNFILVRSGTETATSHDPDPDVIVALNRETAELHQDRLKPGGVILGDGDLQVSHPAFHSLPLARLAKEAGNPRVAGTGALGYLLKMLGLGTGVLKELLAGQFSGEVLAANLSILETCYSMGEVRYELPPGAPAGNLLLNGNEAVALGALAAGLDFYSAYPMTPSTGIMNVLAASRDKTGIVVEQAEDEIAAINMAIGASYGGARAMTGTSGGGFSLMVEALGLAGITETPVLVANVQRPGPATGFPTRTEQGDLSFVLTAAQGEFPRMVTSVRNPRHAFDTTFRALNLADKYQIPVILLSDQYVADVSRTTEPPDLADLEIERHLADPGEWTDREYRRYSTEYGPVSPRLVPGAAPGQVVVADSDEHTEEGHITESAEMRIRMTKKRMGKMKMLAGEMEEPLYEGPGEPETVLVGWGSMEGPLLEAREILGKKGYPVGVLVFGDLYPLPVRTLFRLRDMKVDFVGVEQNATGQLARLIRQETGIAMSGSILRFDGRQMCGQEIAERWLKEVKEQ